MANVPKFGNWENGVPYTAHFEKARRGRPGKMINPNDPHENPSAFPGLPPAALTPKHDLPNDPHANYGGFQGTPAIHVPKNERARSREESELRRQTDAGGRNERSIGHAPPQPHYQESVTIRDGTSSLPSERRDPPGGAQSFAPVTPERPKTRPANRGDDNPGKGAAIPKFGAWEANPACADGYTVVFNKARKERIGPMKPPLIRTEEPAAYVHEEKVVRSWRWWWPAACLGKR